MPQGPDGFDGTLWNVKQKNDSIDFLPQADVRDFVRHVWFTNGNVSTLFFYDVSGQATATFTATEHARQKIDSGNFEGSFSAVDVLDKTIK